MVASRPGCGLRVEEAIEASSEIGMEILLYLTSTKEERYAIIARVRPSELVVGNEECTLVRTG